MYPDSPHIHKRRWDCANDLAWFLVNKHDSRIGDPQLAVQLATQATEAAPECATYWNTLGAALYGVGDAENCITAIEHSMALTDGGTAFDFVFLALAHAQLKNAELARFWQTRAMAWMAQHEFHHPELTRLNEEVATCLASRSEPTTTVS
jgi:hypothetical protein